VSGPGRAALYRMIWRWHFYAGLFVIPFILLLSVSGAAYLFKPQVERWEESGFRTAGAVTSVPPHRQVAAVLAASPGAFLDYRLPEKAGDPAMVRVASGGGAVREVFVGPDGAVRGMLDPETRIMAWAKRVHGELLIGRVGNWLVELAASWAIVMILTGLYLWWPRGGGMAGVVWPRLRGGRRVFWRDLHAVTGFWVAGLALVLLVTAMPWAGVWGAAFAELRDQAGWVKGAPQWEVNSNAAATDLHAHHMPAASSAQRPASFDPVMLDRMVANAQRESLAFPAIVTPPGAPGRFGAQPDSEWSIRSDAQNRPLRVTVRYEAATGQEVSRDDFASSHAIDRAVGYGVAWHEGQLLGWVNQAIGVLTALALVALAISGFVLWRRRKPAEGLGAPPAHAMPARMGGVAAILLILALLLPMLALSLVALVLFERLALPWLPRLARWLGMPARHRGGWQGNHLPR